MFSIQWMVWIAQWKCSVYSVRCTVCSMQCLHLSFLLRPWSTLTICAGCSQTSGGNCLCALSAIHCTLCNTLSAIHCLQYSALNCTNWAIPNCTSLHCAVLCWGILHKQVWASALPTIGNKCIRLYFLTLKLTIYEKQSFYTLHKFLEKCVRAKLLCFGAK